MKLKQISLKVWNGWWLKPLLLACVLFFVIFNLLNFAGLNAGEFGWLPVITIIIVSFGATAAWAGLRKAKETQDSKKIFISGYLVGAFFAVLTEFLVIFPTCDWNNVCTWSYEFPPGRYKLLIETLAGQSGMNLQYFIQEYIIKELIFWAFIVAGIACGVVAFYAAKFLKQKGKKKTRKRK